MKRIFIGLMLFVLTVSSASAAVYNCLRRYSAVMGNNFQIPTVNITLNRNTPDNTVLYTYKHMTPGVQGHDNCESSNLIWHSTLQNATVPVYEGSIDGFNVSVYPTNVPGLGISVNDTDAASAGNKRPIKAYPSILSKNLAESAINYMGMWVDIRLWKISGDVPLQPGSISFVGPTINQGLLSKVATDSFSDTTASPEPGKWFTGSYSHIVGNINLINSTCNIIGGDKTVNLGSFEGNASQSWEKSEWKDASFNISCPSAWGYGGQRGNGGYSSSTGLGDYGSIQSANNIKNNPLTIRIAPRTEVVIRDRLGNALGGTIALDAGGAQGYGVQLAWGDVATLGSGQPTNPVVFNTAIPAYSLNSAAYRSTAYDFGASSITAGKDGTIKMAARFMRIAHITAPGPARAVVDVIVEYN